MLDYYLQQRKNLPEAFIHRSSVINNPSFFKVEDLQRHLNNPLLQPEWVHVKLSGDREELEKNCFHKTVQGRKLYFLDKELLNNEISEGAAVVLERIDVLDSNLN